MPETGIVQRSIRADIGACFTNFPRLFNDRYER
jgi:hypothetical protein